MPRAQIAPRHDHGLVESGEPDQSRGRAILDQPVELRARVERANAREREARAHHVAERAEPDHEHALGGKRRALAPRSVGANVVSL